MTNNFDEAFLLARKASRNCTSRNFTNHSKIKSQLHNNEKAKRRMTFFIKILKL